MNNYDNDYPIQFDFAANWDTLVRPHLNDPDVQDALDEGMQDYYDTIYAYHTNGKPKKRIEGEKRIWKRGDPPCNLAKLVYSSDELPSSEELAWYQPWGGCHFIAPFVLALGKKIYPHLNWELMSSDRHTIAIGCSPWTYKGKEYKDVEDIPCDNFRIGDVKCQIIVLMDILNFNEISASQSLDFANEAFSDEGYHNKWDIMLRFNPCRTWKSKLKEFVMRIVCKFIFQ